MANGGLFQRVRARVFAQRVACLIGGTPITANARRTTLRDDVRGRVARLRRMPEVTHRTTCSRDCPDACGILATVTDGRVTKLTGDPDHPVTRGFLCLRTSRFLEHQYAPDRLRTALVRRGNRQVEASVESALDLVADRLTRIRTESGPAAILHYRSGGSLGLLKMLADRLFESFGPCSTKSGDICSGAGEAAQEHDFGVSDSNDLFDLHHARDIYLWGKNPFVSNVHLIPVLREARQRGARITSIDPIHHKGVGLADRVVAPRPGGDLALAIGIGRVLADSGGFDPAAHETCEGLDDYLALLRRHSVADCARAADVDESLLRDLATDFRHDRGPTAILVGWGMQRRLRGGAIVRALDALSAVTGNLFRSGGGCSFYFKRRRAFDSSAVCDEGRSAPRRFREPMLGHDILAAKDPPIRAIWVTAGNPVAMLPEAAAVAEAFERTEFSVVVDPLLTDTGRRASVVLPVPTLLEDDDLLGAYGHHWLGESRPVVPPPPGVLHELNLLQGLARRLGIEGAMAGSIDDWKRRLLAPVAARGVTLDALRNGAVRNPLAGAVRFADRRVATPSGRVRLPRPTDAEFIASPLVDSDRANGANGDPVERPLWLFSNSTERSQASVWVGGGVGERTWVTVHPDAVPGLRAGDVVWVESEVGRLEAELRLDPKQRIDVAIMPKGGHFDGGHSANAIIRARPTDLGLGAAYLDCRVRVVAGGLR